MRMQEQEARAGIGDLAPVFLLVVPAPAVCF